MFSFLTSLTVSQEFERFEAVFGLFLAGCWKDIVPAKSSRHAKL